MPKRFDETIEDFCSDMTCCVLVMREKIDGNYVIYDDYMKLDKQNDQLRDQLVNWEKVANAWMQKATAWSQENSSLRAENAKLQSDLNFFSKEVDIPIISLATSDKVKPMRELAKEVIESQKNNTETIQEWAERLAKEFSEIKD